MSLGQPDLYIGGQLMQTAKADPRPALAGLRIGWGTDSRVEMDPPSNLSGQLLIKGEMPSFLETGAPVGLIDPVSARCLFAGTLGPLKAVPDESVRDAMRVSFTATSPMSELIKHTVIDVNWDMNTPGAIRFNTLASAMPAGWQLTGSTGDTWIHQSRHRWQSKEWLHLAERFCRSYIYRYHDTSTYTPGGGLVKRITFARDRDKTLFGTTPSAGSSGVWSTAVRPFGSSGLIVLPTSVVSTDIEWQKSPEDMITDVQVETVQNYSPDADADSKLWEYNMSLPPVSTDNSALQAAYGFRQVKIETSLSAYDSGAFGEKCRHINAYWLDTSNKWRPTGLQLPDSRVIATEPMLNLLAVDTRGTTALIVPGATALAPGLIQSFVMAGTATWTGKKWTTDLTLGRTL